MATSDEEIEEVIDDISLASGDDGSLLEEVDVEVAFEGDVENSDDESAVRTKKKKITAHVHVERNIDQSEEEDNIECEKSSRRNLRRKGPEKPEGSKKSEEENNNDGQEVATAHVTKDEPDLPPETKVHIVIEHCVTPTGEENDKKETTENLGTEGVKTEKPKLKWHQRFAQQRRKKWLWPKKKRTLTGDEEDYEGNENEIDNEDGEMKKKKDEDGGEEEEEDTIMTEEEKEDMYNAVRNGDYLLFQDLLDKKNADINMLWYWENLLMVAMRAHQFVMAEFLIDNGIDYNYETTLLDLKDREKTGKRFFQYKLSCRQMAYDLGLLNVVEMIDVKNNQIHKYYKPTPRIPRMRRPPPPPPPCLMYSDEEEDDDEDMLAGGDSDLFSSNSQLADTSESKAEPVESKTEPVESKAEITDNKSPDRKAELTADRIAELDITDDGHESITQSAKSVVNRYELFEERPGLLRRGTKSSMGLQQHNDMKYKRRIQSKSAHPRTGINVVGSYTWESKRWRPTKSESTEKKSEDGFPFVAMMSPSPLTHISSLPPRKNLSMQRPLSSPASFSVEIQNILRQNRLLRTSDPALPYIKPPSKGPRSQSAKAVTPWCHSNSSAVFERLSNTKINNRIRNPRFSVCRQISMRINR